MRDLKKGYGDDRGYFTPDSDDAPILRGPDLGKEELEALNARLNAEKKEREMIQAKRNAWIENLPPSVGGFRRDGWELYKGHNFVLSLQSKMGDENWDLSQVECWVRDHSFCE